MAQAPALASLPADHADHGGHDDHGDLLVSHGSVLQTQIPNGKIAMWLFLGSEVMFFTGLIGAYIVLRFGQPEWPNPALALNVPLTAANTFLLVCSSVTLVWGLQNYQRDDQRRGFYGLLLTTFFGAVFVGVQVYEYFELVGYGLTPHTNIFASCFYIMTSFHGMHVAVGVIALAVLTVMGWMGKFGPKNYAAIENAGLYWHFVDLVWIILFAIVYLM